MAASTPPTPSRSTPSAPVPAGLAELLRGAGRIVEGAKVFGSVEIRPDRLVCAALASAAPAEYRLFVDAGKLWAGFFTPDRWLSQSIEQDLVHTGDKVGELIAEELVELDVENPVLAEPEHFRDDDKQFTFRSPVPVAASEFATPAGAELAAKYLLAYEAALRTLGDVDTSEE